MFKLLDRKPNGTYVHIDTVSEKQIVDMIKESEFDVYKASDVQLVADGEQDDWLDDKYVKVENMEVGTEYVLLVSECYWDTILSNIAYKVVKEA